MTPIEALPVDFKLPRRAWPYGPDEILAMSREHGMTDPEALDIEVELWAEGEWVWVTRTARKQIEQLQLDVSTVWPSIHQALLLRHQAVWGRYSRA